MKRIFSLLLCICMLASTVMLFSSCGAKKVDFANDYTVVYASDVSDMMVEEITAFSETLKGKAGGKVTLKKVKPDADLADEAEFEVLVGNTNRPETAKALKKVKGHGYIITVVGQKLVIVGTTNFLTSLALEKFEELYLAGTDSVSMLEIEKLVQETEMLHVDEKWAFIYTSYVDGDRDYINVAIKELKTQIGTFSGVRGTAMPMMNEGSSAKNEILVGLVDRNECKSLAESMDANNYGISARNGKLLVTAYDGGKDGIFGKAMALFTNMLRDSVYEEDGRKELYVPADFTRIYAENDAIVTDFPRPEGLTLSGTIDVHQGYEYYYTGAGVSADSYKSYCEKLVAAGYELYTDNTVENSIFRTYNNVEKNITLYVAYNAFKHAEAQKTNHQKAIRIVAAPLDGVNLVEQDKLEQDFSYEKLQNSSITAVRLDYMASTEENPIWGNLYVITLEDGSFIVLDGGIANTTDRDRLYKVLLDLYKKGHDDQDPTADNPLRIAAWYISHGHGDHYGSMERFINFYCKNYSTYFVTIDRLIGNLASNEEYYNSESDRNQGLANMTVRNKLAEYSSYMKDAPGEKEGMDYIKLHTGQKFWLANIELEVLHTHEDQYPNRIHIYNNTSTAIRMTIHHSENGVASESSKTTAVWLGDAQTNASAFMRATYGNYLKSDMVQIAHHGGNGCEWALYQLIAPTCAWWPAGKSGYKSYHKSDAKGYALVSYNVNYKLKSLQYIILSDVCNYTVTITATGADYSIGGATGIYSAYDGAMVTLGNVMASTSTGFMRTVYNKS